MTGPRPCPERLTDTHAPTAPLRCGSSAPFQMRLTEMKEPAWGPSTGRAHPETQVCPTPEPSSTPLGCLLSVYRSHSARPLHAPLGGDYIPLVERSPDPRRAACAENHRVDCRTVLDADFTGLPPEPRGSSCDPRDLRDCHLYTFTEEEGGSNGNQCSCDSGISSCWYLVTVGSSDGWMPREIS